MSQIYVTQLPDRELGIIHLAPPRIHDRADFDTQEEFDEFPSAIRDILTSSLEKERKR